ASWWEPGRDRRRSVPRWIGEGRGSRRAGPAGRVLLRCPGDWLRLDGVCRTVARSRPARAGEPADGPDGHVVVTEDLAAQANASDVLRSQDVLLGGGHRIGLAGDELDAAGGAASVATTGMELVDLGLVGERQDKAFAGGHVEFTDTFNGQLR